MLEIAKSRLPTREPVRDESKTGLEHRLAPLFGEIARFSSTSQLRRAPLFSEIEPELNRIQNTVVCEDYGSPRQVEGERIRAVAWNIERGSRLEGILEILRTQRRLKDADILFLTELDLGMARSGNRFIARELAAQLGLNFAFANCYVSLVKGSGLEYDIAGENSLALHGNALMSAHPLCEAHRLALPNGKDKMKGKEKRLGQQQAVLARVEHPNGDFWAVSLHLDAHSTQRHRYRQMKIVLDHLRKLKPLPVLIGGDWNTSTYNSKRAVYSILGYARRVLMGVQHVIENHYQHPENWFERHLFRLLEKRGYNYRDLNQLGVGTLHYHVNDEALNTNMGDWIPGWCFWFIRWALEQADGGCSMKLDWFSGRGIEPVSDSPPRVVGEVHDRDNPLSDHDPICLDFRLL